MRPLVLCVDDDREVLVSLRRTLRASPCDVVTTADPGEALEWIRSGQVGVLIADERMPRMSGSDLVSEARRESPATACIILTGFAGGDTALKAKCSGSVALMSKPWDDDALRTAVCELVGAPLSRPEALVHVECRDRRAGAVLDDLRASFDRGEELTVVLHGLGDLQDSLFLFFETLVDEVRRTGTRVTLVDDSGSARILLGALGRHSPITVLAQPPAVRN